MRSSMLVPLLLALAACASQPQPAAPAVVAADAPTPAASEVQRNNCHKQATIGSNMIHTVCTPEGGGAALGSGLGNAAVGGKPGG